MEKYVEKVLAKWLPGGPLPRVQDSSLPYSRQFQARLDEALKRSTTSPDYPELIKPFQQCLGQLMYAACGARPDIAYPVFRLCSAMSGTRPVDLTFGYASRAVAVFTLLLPLRCGV